MKNPCGSCPYRRDVPSGIWDASEYAKLPGYDEPPGEGQPMAAFFCHQQDDELCSGWVGCHDMRESFGLRLALMLGLIGTEQYEQALEYESPVELFASGAEAASHGMREIDEPGERARRVVAKLERKQERES